MLTTCVAREQVTFETNVISRLQKTLKEQMVLYKNQKKENDEIQKKQDAVSNTPESYFMSHILWVMNFLGAETIGRRGEVAEKDDEVITLKNKFHLQFYSHHLQSHRNLDNESRWNYQNGLRVMRIRL